MAQSSVHRIEQQLLRIESNNAFSSNTANVHLSDWIVGKWILGLGWGCRQLNKRLWGRSTRVVCRHWPTWKRGSFALETVLFQEEETTRSYSETVGSDHPKRNRGESRIGNVFRVSYVRSIIDTKRFSGFGRIAWVRYLLVAKSGLFMTPSVPPDEVTITDVVAYEETASFRHTELAFSVGVG